MGELRHFLEVEHYDYNLGINDIHRSSIFRTLFVLIFLSIFSSTLMTFTVPWEEGTSINIFGIILGVSIKVFILFFVFKYFLSSSYVKEYEEFLNNLKDWITKRTLERQEIYFFKPKLQNDYTFSTISPKKVTYTESDSQNIPKNKNNFFLLNLESYSEAKFLVPYCSIIICNKIFKRKIDLWYYFLVLFFAINIIYSFFIFILLFNVEYFFKLWSTSEYAIFLLGAFIASLTVIFAKTIWSLIKNMRLESCDKKKLLNQFKKVTKLETETELEKYLKYILVLDGTNEYIPMKKYLKRIDKINKGLTNNLTSIIQMTSPLFYLAYITITIAILL